MIVLNRTNQQTMNSNNFEEHDVVIKNEDGTKVEKHLIFSSFIDPNLMKSLVDITDNEKFYNDMVEVTPQYLYQFFEEITKRAQGGNDALLPLACYLGDFFKDKINQYNKMSADGKITFDNLNNIFSIGTRFVAYTTNNCMIGSVVHNTHTESGMFGDKHFVITGVVTISNGKEFVQVEKNFVIDQFGGLSAIKDLQVRPMSDSEFKDLTERGRNFVKYGLGTHYLSYTGEMFKESMYGPVHFNATGRVMVDVVGFNTTNPNYDRTHRQSKNVCNPDVPEDLLFMTHPFLQGFSFASKQWGEIYIDKLEEIKYDDNAFDYLVLNSDYKEMAKALVTNVNISFSDIISGKSGGCIFLLHGPPGTGKTLTCEAIAELLHRPLYSITVGELGTTPDILEKKLSIILEIANSWSAVILIDEADIFLEKRTDNNIARNAMVGIFLRLLERHQGVLFLTTNRKEQLDEAFRSRISVIIEYKELDKSSRMQVWGNLLRAANVLIDADTINQLSDVTTHDGKYINGRQIKNAIRMAQCLAHNKNEPVDYKHLSRVIELM